MAFSAVTTPNKQDSSSTTDDLKMADLPYILPDSVLLDGDEAGAAPHAVVLLKGVPKDGNKYSL